MKRNSMSRKFMGRKWFGILALIALAGFLSSVSSCGFNQHLVGIQVQPLRRNFQLGWRDGKLPRHRNLRASACHQRHYQSRNLVGR